MIFKNRFKLNKTIVRTIYWSIVLLFMVFVAFPLFFFFYSFNEEQVKQMLFEQLDNKNYHVTVSGEITPKLWHGLSFEVNGLEIATSKDVDLIHIKTLKCQLSWFDLALGRYRVKRMALSDVKLNEKNLNNYGISNLLNASKIDNSAFGDLEVFHVNNITSIYDQDLYPIQNGNLTMYRENGVSKFNLAFKLDQTDTHVNIDGVFRGIAHEQIKFNKFMVDVYNDQMNVKLNADAVYKLDSRELSLDQVDGDINYDGYIGKVNMQKIIFDLQRLLATNIFVDFTIGNVFANQNIKLNISEILYDKYKKIFIKQIDSDYKLDIYNSKINLVSKLTNLEINNKHVISNQCLHFLRYDFPNFESMVANLNGVCEYQLNNKQYNFNLRGELNQSPFDLNLKVNMLIDKPKINLKSSFNKLYLSHINNNNERSVFYYDDSALPFAWLSTFDINSDLKVKEFIFDRVHLSNLTTHLNLESNVLTVDGLNARVYYGQLSGNFRIEKNNDSYNIRVNNKINGLDLQSIFEDLFDVGAISGQSNVIVNATINNAKTYSDLHKLINGYVSIEAINGAFQGVDFNLFSDPKIGFVEKSTIFKQLKADFNFNQGVSKNGRVVFYSPYVIANGNGLVDFVDNKLSYKLTIKSALPQNEENMQSVVIPVAVDGDLFNPKISIESIYFSAKNPILRNANGRLDKFKNSRHKKRH